MTKRQIKRLETIIAKVETLQATLKRGAVADYLQAAKTDLLRALVIGQ